MKSFRGVVQKGYNKGKILLSIGTSEPDPRTAEVHSNELYTVGIGYLGGMKALKRRRFLRSRTAEGISSYKLWTHPQKGEEYMFVRNFRGRVNVTKEKIEAHFKNVVSED